MLCSFNSLHNTEACVLGRKNSTCGIRVNSCVFETFHDNIISIVPTTLNINDNQNSKRTLTKLTSHGLNIYAVKTYKLCITLKQKGLLELEKMETLITNTTQHGLYSRT